MKLKVTFLVCAMSAALAGYLSYNNAQASTLSVKDAMQPFQNEPVTGTRTPTYPIRNEIEKQSVFLAPYDKHKWTLNGISGESYYLTCPPNQRCIKPIEHITIYTYKSQAERDAGVAEYKAQLEKTGIRILWWKRAYNSSSSSFSIKVERSIPSWVVSSVSRITVSILTSGSFLPVRSQKSMVLLQPIRSHLLLPRTGLEVEECRKNLLWWNSQ